MERTEPRPYRWTREDYYQACEAGLFLQKRVQLIGGEIIEMPAMKNRHALGIALTDDALRQALGPHYWVRVQMSLDLDPLSVPDPDLAVIAGSIRSHVEHENPTTALLIVEVADTTLAFDRHTKASLYAASGIADYWILNVSDEQLEVFRDPQADPSTPFGHHYATRHVLVRGDTINPLAVPSARLAVTDLLP